MACPRVLICATCAIAAVAIAGGVVQGQGRIRRLGGLVPVPVAVPAEKVDVVEESDNDDAPGETRSVVLHDNGDLRRGLEQIRQQIDGERFADAARMLGQLLQAPEIHDFFLSRDDQRRDGRSFLTEIRHLIEELPATGMFAYREQFEAVARTRLNAAIAGGGELALRDVAVRFPETRAGDEALYRLGLVLRDHGRAHAAAACLRRLQARPEASAAFEPALSLTLAACWARTGDRREALNLLAGLRNRQIAAPIQIAGHARADLLTDTGWADYLDRNAITDSEADFAMPIAAGDWLTFRGNPSRNAAVGARSPFLAPRWSHPAAGDAQTQLAIDRSWQRYCEGSGTALPLISPLAAGDLVFARTARGVAAFDLFTGDCRWRAPSDDDGENAGLDRILWREPAGGSYAVDEECVYLVDDFTRDEMESTIRNGNTLSAREHFLSREGNLRWQIGGGDGGTEPRLAGAFFLGPPLTWYGSLYILAESKGALSLVALDRLTGRLSWSQELALVEQRISDDLLRLMGGATPSLSAEEIIVCPTSGGVVVALDLTTRSLLWAYRYVQKAPMRPTSVDEADSVQHFGQFDRWLDGTLSIAAGRVVLTPVESREIHCLNLKDGRPNWTKARDDGMFVACVTDDAVIVVGRASVRALRLSDGEVIWTLLLDGQKSALAASPRFDPGCFPAGRGVFALGRYFLPVTSSAVLEIELSTGTLAATHKSPRELTSGNLIWHRGLFVSQGSAALEVFDERNSLAVQVRAELERNPRDPEALVRHGELELSAGHVSEAISAFRIAHQAARSPKTRTRLIGALLDGVRQNLPGHELFAAELDTLIGP